MWKLEGFVLTLDYPFGVMAVLVFATATDWPAMVNDDRGQMRWESEESSTAETMSIRSC